MKRINKMLSDEQKPVDCVWLLSLDIYIHIGPLKGTHRRVVRLHVRRHSNVRSHCVSHMSGKHTP